MTDIMTTKDIAVITFGLFVAGIFFLLGCLEMRFSFNAGEEAGEVRGYKAGKREGVSEGEVIGEKYGREQGRAEGYQTGFTEGREQGKRDAQPLRAKNGWFMGRGE